MPLGRELAEPVRPNSIWHYKCLSTCRLNSFVKNSSDGGQLHYLSCILPSTDSAYVLYCTYIRHPDSVYRCRAVSQGKVDAVQGQVSQPLEDT